MKLAITPKVDFYDRAKVLHLESETEIKYDSDGPDFGTVNYVWGMCSVQFAITYKVNFQTA